MKPRKSICFWLAAGVVFVSSFSTGLLAGRVLFEALFPVAAWLGKLAPALLLGLVSSILGLVLWQVLSTRLSGHGWRLQPLKSSGERAQASCLNLAEATLPFIPWLAGLLYLDGSEVNLIEGRLLLFGCIWLSTVFLAWIFAKPGSWKWLGPLLLVSALAPIYLNTLGRSVGTADTFEFQVVVPKLGIVHPTGYPLYLLLTKFFTYLPVNSVAWRVNLATALFGLAAACFIFWLLWRLQRRPLPAILAALFFGLTPTFWSQAVEAEVYTLHALIVASALFLMREIGGWSLDANGRDSTPSLNNQGQVLDSSKKHSTKPIHQLARFVSQPYGQTILLALLIGVGLTNHLTTVILLPGALLTVFFAFRQKRYTDTGPQGIRAIALVLGALLVPLILYAYLPLRWQAVNGESMGFGRFVDWVIGGRFQGALQLKAFINDTTRYEIVGRLIEFDWQPLWLLLFSLLGGIWLLIRSWRYGLIILLTWLGFIFYGLSYYVPDLAVFLIPVFLIISIWWGVGLTALLEGLDKLLDRMAPSSPRSTEIRSALKVVLSGLIFILLLSVMIKTTSGRWTSIDASQDDGRLAWGKAVLSLPIDDGAAILADSDKFPPLYYLQQVDDIRPDLDILLLPDEQAYRSELDQRLSQGQSVYLARFIPGLEGIYHLTSEGPLTKVSANPIFELPGELMPTKTTFGPVQLKGYTVNTESFAEGLAAFTLYWSTEEPLDEVRQVYVRLEGVAVPGATTGRHPANNYYPTVAWETGEIVSDFHLLTVPPGGESSSYQLQVALAPPFTPENELEWANVTTLEVEPAAPADLRPIQVGVGPNYLDGISFPDQVRPQSELAIIVRGEGHDKEGLRFELRPAESGADDNSLGGDRDQKTVSGPDESFILTTHLSAGDQPGIYDVVVSYPGIEARCGWLSSTSDSCSVGQIEISGVPLAENARNFEDKIALNNLELMDYELVPGGLLELNLQWQVLTSMNQDYTVFVQVLDAQDRIVGQVDSWPLQGTYPTSQWQPGELIDDPYQVQLDSGLESGQYRIHVGLYLLETLQRMSVLDETGTVIDDKVEMTGRYVP